MKETVYTFFNQKQLDKLTKTELNLINFASKYPEKFYRCSIKQLSNNTGISLSIISRLAKKLDFDSLKDMQFYVYHNFLNTDLKVSENINYDKLILKQLFLFYKESISQTSHLLNLNEVNEVIQHILSHERIYLYGAGSSHLSASELATNMQKLGINSVAFRDFHSLLLITTQIDIENKFVILFSKSCNTREIKFIVNLFTKYHIKFCLITSNKQSKEKYENVILYSTIEQSKRFVSISSKINQHFIADLIFLILQSKKVKNYDDKLSFNLDILEQWNK
ncbi:MurR/RpiR family transcriptional regulator [Mycoplasmopsis citelli]|uniref:Transcriptional regulator n=1 Tax=Mycoplasmopsis citelli TaxID=171281 RepID=A0A449B385_9BACT|nr:MurR/RpiR family transcriptional regulator [Mycoplasmopsis citelli]UUD36357.1 MurR/RpiR family transcriptional regulator [Mycoplasmopsis citelli]VEU75059.1 Transcriptional regulator [Mycoplasmopsis citelli]